MCGDSQSTFYNNTMVKQPGQHGLRGARDGRVRANVKNNIFMNNDRTATCRRTATSARTPARPDHKLFRGAQPGAAPDRIRITTCFGTGNCAGFVNMAAGNFPAVVRKPGAARGGHARGALQRRSSRRPSSAPFDLGAFGLRRAAGADQSANSSADPDATRTLDFAAHWNASAW